METQQGMTSNALSPSAMTIGTNRIPLTPGREDRLGLELQEVTNASPDATEGGSGA